MITETFDLTTEAVISPENFYGMHKTVCDICIITFSAQVIDEIRRYFPCEKITELESTNGAIPCYKLNYKGKEIAFYMTMIGAPGAGACLEEARCLIGASKYIMFGSCGCLDCEITSGKVIVPTHAYRDEGLSYHYAEASEYIMIRNADFVASFFEKTGIPYVTGKTWTTDAIYRETRGNMEKRKAQGCISVEMESAAIQAVCDFRNLEFYNFYLGGDLLDAPEWDHRLMGEAEECTVQVRCFYLAMELALCL